jgi:glycine dehydrogenase
MPEAQLSRPKSTPAKTRRSNPSVKVTDDPLAPTDTFLRRHIGPSPEDVDDMLEFLGYDALDDLINTAVPAKIRLKKPLHLPAPLGERQTLDKLKTIMGRNKVFRSYIGMGYHDCVTPTVIQRNILENPGWYTAYTPYQAEIAQGRLQALLNFQTMIMELTQMEIANASMLDEATAAAEAMTLCHSQVDNPARNVFFVSEQCHPQTIDVVQTRAHPLGLKVVVGDHRTFKFDDKVFGLLVQYPATHGQIFD